MRAKNKAKNGNKNTVPNFQQPYGAIFRVRKIQETKNVKNAKKRKFTFWNF
jgi:hypothetical protein